MDDLAVGGAFARRIRGEPGDDAEREHGGCAARGDEEREPGEEAAAALLCGRGGRGDDSVPWPVMPAWERACGCSSLDDAATTLGPDVSISGSGESGMVLVRAGRTAR